MINLIKSKYPVIGQTKTRAQLLAEAAAKTGQNLYRTQPSVGMNPQLIGISDSISSAPFTPPDLRFPAPPPRPTPAPTPAPNTQTIPYSSFSGKTFGRFTTDDKVENQTELITGGVWSTGVGSLITHFTSSTQTITQRRYYVDVLNSLPGSTDALVQYSVAYGHANGSGSDSVGQISDSPSKAIYSQFKQLLLNSDESRFTTQGSGSTDSIYAITFKRNRMKERLDPGNFEIPLRSINTRDQNASGSVTTGSIQVTLIDDSAINPSPYFGAMGRVYNIISGSIQGGIHNASAPVYYGKAYPDYGVIILDGNVLDQRLAFKTQMGASIEGNNHFALVRSISGSAFHTSLYGDKYGFQARNSEKVTSAHFFVRVRNSEFNFSNNPSYITGSQGDIRELSFKKDPITYITTVGLYNDDYELLAVAKVSKPILKSFSRESLIRVKLDF